MRTVIATRYVAPLREGGSLPAIVEGDDEGLYVLKFRGAGQGVKALMAELLGGEIARALGLPVPELVYIDLDPALGNSEPDGEIQALVQNSGGLNLGLDYLPGALAYDPLITPRPDAVLASAIVWLDAYISNVDRTARNTNMLLWHRQLYLIDHGAAFYFQYRGDDFTGDSQKAFSPIRDHVLVHLASQLAVVDEELTAKLTPEVLARIVGLIPEEWLAQPSAYPDAATHRAAFLTYLTARLAGPRAFAEEAMRVRARSV